jgi:7,8-dihydropterin-6-yl-methyl-4-(beta-D-ribofuranosyl)aminobenzene 5'-phosphate synthase
MGASRISRFLMANCRREVLVKNTSMRICAILCMVTWLSVPVIASSNTHERSSPVDTSRSEIKVTVVYDNRSDAEELEPAWGFACVVEGLEKTILFDTGDDAPTLLSNMSRLGFAPQDVDLIVLSHAHHDHFGGLSGFLKANSDVVVYLLGSFPGSIRDDARRRGAEVVDVTEPTKLCDGALLTGEILGEGEIPEQCLLLHGGAGAAVITGCAHPGIVPIVERAKELTGGNVLVALGGFHLAWDSDDSILNIISRLKELGVRQAMPCHCSGDRAIELFAEAYDKQFVRCIVGTALEVGNIIDSQGR